MKFANNFKNIIGDTSENQASDNNQPSLCNAAKGCNCTKSSHR